MKTLVIGATGYVGSRLAQTFKSAGSDVYGLARSEKSANALSSAGIAPIEGDLAAVDRLKSQLDEFDTIAFAATIPFEDERQVIGELLSSFSKPGRSFVFISGSGVVSTPARDGAWNDYTAAEDDPYPFEPLRNRAIRLITEKLLNDAATEGLRTFIIRPPLIWGHAGSIQVPQLFESARRTGTVCYLGQGLNLYSHVHVDDVATGSRLAFEKGTPGSIYHLVAGEVNFRTIAEAVGEVTGCLTRSLTYDEAVELWGAPWVDLGLAVNSRIRSPRTRSELGWTPAHVDLIGDIRQGSYKKAYDNAKQSGTVQGYSWAAHG
ncbi:NAD-dependent epimerase/dehydratase family protein [Agrobacterium radiobacter]|uniref:NAD-dependent epimerase/dehydratase family protein n=1 Tax=Agrobacterium radiobacter TaxID=362 RepID=UPI003F875282